MRYVAAVLANLMVLYAACPAEEKMATREEAVRTLHEFNRCLEEKDFKKALALLHLPKELAGKESELLKQLETLPGSSEISKKGIDVLAEKGGWKPLASILREEKAKQVSNGLPLDKCFGLFATPNNGAAFYWDGSRFIITFFNNIGSLAEM